MQDTTYNGWTNYATWRVNLEVFDCNPIVQAWTEEFKEPYELSKLLSDYADELICDQSEGLAQDYALAFLHQVNWYEIAEHMIDAYADAA